MHQCTIIPSISRGHLITNHHSTTTYEIKIKIKYMILIIRGHIRNSFQTQDLINFIKTIYNIFPDLHIYIHTWNIFSNNISWRKIQINNTTVTQEIIHNYFGDLKHLIKHIIIDDDSKIHLIGNLVGTINNNNMPIIGWKNYWYGKYKIIDYIYNQHINDNEMIINSRFDIFNNSNIFDKELILTFIKNNNGKTFTKNVFMFDNDETNGIDNIYIGNINTMYKLVQLFYYELDFILSIYNNVFNQERLVYKVNLISDDFSLR
jgi:hypothetical protein